MAIQATFTGHTTVKNAHIKLGRIWGSKEEQWNAWVHVFESPEDKNIVATFSIQCTYVEDANPYTGLYEALAKESCLSDITHVIDSVSPDETVTKKKRGKV